ncbi:MAG TPA: L-serine ammonia-lyase [Vicinamibacterales bacterium]
MRGAVITAAAVMTGCTKTETEANAPPPVPAAPAQAAPAVPLSADLEVVKKSKGPVMTVLDEFYKVGPGPSSSHTIGPMRITYDFYQRSTKLPADQLAKATGLRVNLFGSLSATGKGHGTERAALAGLIGKEPATVDPKFLDSLITNPDQTFPVKLGDKTVNVTLKDVIYDATKGDFHHPNTMTCKLLAGNDVLLEQEYYSVGGGFIEWKGYTPPKKNAPKYPFSTMKELREHADKNKLTIAQVMLANEMAIPGKTEAEVWAFVDKIINAMNATVKSGLAVSEDDVLPGPIKLHSKAATVYKRAMTQEFQADRGIAVISAYALAGSEENGRGHLVITAPTGGSAGVMPALVHALGEGGRKLSQDKIRDGMLAAAAIGYLCKHNATLSAAEGGCQAEIGVASAMAAAMLVTAYGGDARVVENAAESALEHHLGMTCDPVAGYVQVPCIERCAFGAVKAWTAYLIATNEIASRHRVDLDATITALAQTAKDMNSKYKETSEAGLALSVTLC